MVTGVKKTGKPDKAKARGGYVTGNDKLTTIQN